MTPSAIPVYLLEISPNFDTNGEIYISLQTGSADVEKLRNCESILPQIWGLGGCQEANVSNY